MKPNFCILYLQENFDQISLKEDLVTGDSKIVS